MCNSQSSKAFLNFRYSLQASLMRGVFPNAKDYNLFSLIFHWLSLHCKLVPVQYRGYEYGLHAIKFVPVIKIILRLTWARFPPLSRVRSMPSGRERGLLSRTAAGNRAQALPRGGRFCDIMQRYLQRGLSLMPSIA